MSQDYEQALARLTEKAERAAIRPKSNAPIFARPRRGTPRSVLGWIVSRFIEGEDATAAFCAEVRRDIKGPVARRFIELQGADEIRHAERYRAYLHGLGKSPSPSDALDGIYRRARTFDGPVEGRLLAFHVILERDNLSLQRGANRLFGCPAFDALGQEIQRDEARHVAFGDLYLRRHLPALPLPERVAIHDWLRDLWFDAADEILRETLGPLAAMDRRRRRRDGWAKRQRTLESVGLMTPDERASFGAAS